MRVAILMAGDAVALTATLILCAAVYQQLGGQYQLTNYLRLWPLLPVFVCLGSAIRLYHGNVFYPGAPLLPVEELRRVFFAALLTYLLFFSYLALTHRAANYSRVVLVFSCAISPFGLIAVRKLLREVMHRCQIAQIPVLIAGGGKSGRLFAAEFAANAYFGYRPVGFADDNGDLPGVLGPLAAANDIGRKYDVSTLIVCLPLLTVQERLRDFMKHFKYIQILLSENSFPISWAYPISISGYAGVELQNQLLLPAPRLLKQLSELALAAVAILLAWPFFLILALLVKCSSPGPVLYRAKRVGLNGKPIEVWKFRTMYADADQRLDRLLNESPQLAQEWQAKFKLDEDPRITPVGNFLRKSSLDELPQLFNVIRGEMAMIGPRPIVEKEIPYYQNNYEAFCRVKPGISGLWQVSGRNNTSYEQRVALDMYYIFNWSLWLDLYILGKTFFTVISRKGAR